MAHVINNSSTSNYSEANKLTTAKNSRKLLSLLSSESIEFNRFGISAISLLFVVCFSGVAVGLGGMDSAIEIGLIVAPTMAVLTSVISVQPMKYVLGFTIISVTINLVICAINLVFGPALIM